MLQKSPFKNIIHLSISSLLLSSLLLPSVGLSHERTYAFNQEYRTIPKNQFEIEQHVTSKVPNINKSNSNSFKYETEVEWGITDHWTLAHYQTWTTTNRSGTGKDTTEYSGFKFETKYRFGEKGKYWVDPLIYFEIKHDPREEDFPIELETKIILSKDFGKFNIVYNQIMENEVNRNGRTEHAFTFGANYAVMDDLRLGVEVKGDLWHPSDHRNALSIGPTIAWSNRYFWTTVGVLFGANHAADDLEARVIVGVPIG